MSIICEVDWWAGRDQFQQQPCRAACATAFIVAALAQTGEVGGQFHPICLASNAFISGQQARPDV